jgi:hypothetical protein
VTATASALLLLLLHRVVAEAIYSTQLCSSARDREDDAI